MNKDAQPFTVVANRGLLTICTMIATLMQTLDSTIANVALPYMQGSLGASQDQVNWVLTSYIVAAAIMTAPTGWLTARFGRTRLLVFAVIGFTIASMLCGMSQSIQQIVLCRLLQGMFGASLVPLSQSIMFDIYPPERRGAAMGIWGMGVMVGPVLGPALGGWLTEHYSWRWVFYINVPIGILTTIGLITLLPETSRTRSRFDWTGFLMLALGVGAFQTMLDRGEQLDWFNSPEIILEACLAGIGAYAFIVHFLLAEQPFVSPRLLRDQNFVLGTLCICIVASIQYSTMALMTPYLQNLMNYPVLTAGIVMGPRGIGTMLAMFLCGRLLDHIKVRTLTLFGFVMTTYSLYQMVGFTPDVSRTTVVVNGFILGAASGFVFVALSTVTFATLSVELRTQGTGVYSLLRNLGSSIGISVTGALVTRNLQANHETIGASVTPFNRLLQSGAAARLWNPFDPHGVAALDAVVTRQATMIAYMNDFKLLMMVSLLSTPVIFLIRDPRAARNSKVGAPAME